MPDTVEWEEASISVIQEDKRRGKWRLRLRYAPRKSTKSKQVSSADFNTKEEADLAASWCKLSWGQGNKGHSIDIYFQTLCAAMFSYAAASNKNTRTRTETFWCGLTIMQNSNIFPEKSCRHLGFRKISISRPNFGVWI